MSRDSKTLLFRADANTRIGTGHVMRCLALAQAWQDAGGTALLASAEIPAGLRQRLLAEGINPVDLKVNPGSANDAEATIVAARRVAANWVVMDGYGFGSDYQATIKNQGLLTALYDDNAHQANYAVHLLINHNLHACTEAYRSSGQGIRLLLGTRYVALRREFLRQTTAPACSSPQRLHVLISLGGSDEADWTRIAVEALAQRSDVEVTVTAGAAYPFGDRLRNLAAQAKCRMEVLSNVTNIAALLARTHLCIGAAGISTWERCFMGVPTVLVVLADNQEAIAHSVCRAGAALLASNPSELGAQVAELLGDVKARTQLAAAGRRLMDGQGAGRILAVFQRSDDEIGVPRQ